MASHSTTKTGFISQLRQRLSAILTAIRIHLRGYLQKTPAKRQTNQQTKQPHRLNVINITKHVYMTAWLHRTDLLRASAIPLLVSCLFFALFAGLDFLVKTSWQESIVMLIGLFIQVFVILSFAMLTTYRLMLLGPETAWPNYSDIWLYRYLNYVKIGVAAILPSTIVLVIAVLVIRAVSLPPLLDWILAFVVLMFAPLLYLRLGFTLPAAATDTPYTLMDSWHVTTNILWPLAVVMVLTYGPVALLMVAVSVAYQFSADVWWQAWPLAFVLLNLWYYGNAIHCIANALCFTIHTDWHPGVAGKKPR